MEITNELLIKSLTYLLSNFYMQILFWVIVVDIATGITKAFCLKKFNSSIGINGLLRHLLVLGVTCLVGVYAKALNQIMVWQSISIFFTANYALSIMENWGEIGLPLPSWIKIYFSKLKDDNDKKSPFKIKE